MSQGLSGARQFERPLDWQWLPSLSCVALTPFGFSQPVRSKCHQWQWLSAQKHHLKWKKQAHPRNGERSLIYWTNIMISSCLPRYQGFPTTCTWGNNGLVRGNWSIRNMLLCFFSRIHNGITKGWEGTDKWDSSLISRKIIGDSFLICLGQENFQVFL